MAVVRSTNILINILKLNMWVITVLILFGRAYSYHVGPEQLMFIDAKAYCVGLNSNLARIRSLSENDKATRQCSYHSCWIGLLDYGAEGQWKWTDGSRAKYFNWNRGEPNNYGAGEDCGEIYSENGRWNDLNCYMRRNPLCDDPPATQATCTDILWEGPLWGRQAKGVKIGEYMRGAVPLQFIGCNDNGCSRSSFYCNDGAGYIEFGATAGAVRSLTSDGTFPASFSGCCSAAHPSDICNSPDDQVSVDEICHQLGYDKGTFTQGTDNWCSEPHFHEGNQGWANDFPPYEFNYGRTYTCTTASSAMMSAIKEDMIFEPEEGTFGGVKGYYYLQISQSTFMIICGLVSVILIFNIILLWRANCWKSRKYYRVKNYDTDTDTA